MHQFKKYIESKIKELEAMPYHGEEFPESAYVVEKPDSSVVEWVPIFDESEFLDYFAHLVTEAYIRASAFGYDKEPPATLLSKDDALYSLRSVSAWCDAQPDKTDAEWLSLEQAARYFGYSVDGFRKLVDLARNGEIPLRFSQPVAGGKILFRRTWLDEFAESSAVKTNAQPAETPKRKPRTSKTDETSHGLDWSLFK